MSDRGTNHLTSAQLAEREGVDIRTVQRWRQDGSGPPYLRMPGGRLVVYRESDVEAWEAARRFRSTSEETVKAAKAEPQGAPA
ncbi:helix-turn-helix transcriptional regulator [Falsiroseomonas tokyonensis]|uniref:Helix-turn-helix transcriptional regulator n=1 Tax=Falsiroseomonas tokyonensis TaxID=430521 RepID=A0ABV7BW62_9PROT|nr:helix-turn-helix domain-containing protein [Falsiroseomonas tokyonensis]MBU8538724.1 helix-turn-helix domain-containing protein [Falsiroseomonas tokyonensis]